MLKSFKILLPLALTGWTVMTACGPEQKAAESSLDIVGGSAVNNSLYSNYFQSVASLQMRGSHFCGGTLIAPNKILTAAHCVSGYSQATLRSNLTVVLGTPDLRSTSGAERHRVASVAIDSRYSTRTNQYDAAVITLETDSKYEPVAINRSSSLPEVGETTYVAGWGATREGGYGTNVMNYAAVNAISNETCARVYGSTINNASLCAYTPNVDSCQGDSGGPLFSYDGTKMTVVGIVSWGRGCARNGYPGVYTRVSAL